MRSAGPELSTGERVAYYRRRRGLTQDAFAGLVGRTTSWVEKVENGRAHLDRISVVRELARALGVRFRDLVPDSAELAAPAVASTVPDLTLSYSAVNPGIAAEGTDVAYIGVGELRRQVDEIWTAYQDSGWGYVIARLNQVLPAAYLATLRGDPHRTATRALAHLYHAAESVLVKLGNLGDAWVCAERGDIFAREIEDPVVVTSVQRGVAHALLSNGRYENAVAVVRDGVIAAADPSDPARLSVTGTLMLVGATACARAGERAEAMTFLRHADQLAERLGRDANEVWTSFGPTNVAIHRVTAAAELGDMHRAVELGASLDVHAMARERRVRHQLEVARALSQVGRRDESLHLVLDAERTAPDQVRRHFLTRELVPEWIRTIKTRPKPELVALARRLGHAA